VEVDSLRGVWPSTYRDGVALQERLRARVVIGPLSREVRIVGGVDAAFGKGEGRIYAAVVIFSYPDMEPIEEATASSDVLFPYIPGLLSFREGPAIIDAYRKLSTKPDLLIFDGQGIAHPRRFGIASHMGVLLDLPTIGCAKSRLVGEYREPGLKRGDFSPLFLAGEEVGAVLRTKEGVRPVFVSPGHMIDLETSVKMILTMCKGYRLPQPTRIAHMRVGRVKREEAEKVGSRCE